jgi:thioesterase DpgC
MDPEHVDMGLPQQGAAAGGVRLTGDFAIDRVEVVEWLSGRRPWSTPGGMPSDEIHARRLVAGGFAAAHALSIYDALTERRTVTLSLSRLLYSAAELCPGLTPTADEVEREQALPIASRNRVEIDQGLLLRGVLQDRTAGRHLIEGLRLPRQGSWDLSRRFDATGHLVLPTVTVTRVGQAAMVTMNNTRNLNAEDNQLMADLGCAVDVTLLSASVQVGVLRGGTMTHPKYAGRRVFGAGINLKELAAGNISYTEFLLDREFGFISKMRTGLSGGMAGCFKPWIVVVEAFAIGGGMQLVLAADHVIAEDNAYFSLPAAKEGLVPGVANLRLPRIFGRRGARQMILDGLQLQANAPDARRFCDEVCPTDQVDDAVAAAVLRLAPRASRVNRYLLNVAEEPVDAFREYMAEFVCAQAERMYSQVADGVAPVAPT